MAGHLPTHSAQLRDSLDTFLRMSARVSGSNRSKGLKPIPVRRGPVEVLVYTGINTAAGKRYRRYSLVYREANGERQVQNFSDLQKAKTKAEEIATRLANGETELFNPRNADVAELTSARAVLAPIGFTVAQAANDLAAAVQRLPVGTTLFEAIDWFAKRHVSTAPKKKSVKEVVEEFIADRRSAGC